MLSRRDALGAIGAAAAGGTAGCLDAIPFLGDEPIEFEAATAAAPESVLAETDYEEYDRTDVVVERAYEVAGQTQDVVVTNRQVQYDKAVELSLPGLPGGERLQAAIVSVLTTPQVRVADQTFNPVADMDSEDLATMVQDRYEGMETLQQVGEETVPVASGPTTVGEFEGEAELAEAGVTADLTLHIGEAVEAGDDLIVAVGGYPTALQGQEQADVFAMFEAIDHTG